jgi:hypothetical protein
MPSTLPSTGQQIQMGRIAQALGITANATTQVRLNGQLGVGRNRSLSGVASIPSGSETREGLNFGGLAAPGTY